MGGKEMKKKRKEKCEGTEIRDGAFGIGGEVWELNRIPSHLHFNFLQLSKALVSVFLSSLLSVPLPFCHPLLPLSLYSVFSVTLYYCDSLFLPWQLVLFWGTVRRSDGTNWTEKKKKNGICDCPPGRHIQHNLTLLLTGRSCLSEIQ